MNVLIPKADRTAGYNSYRRVADAITHYIDAGHSWVDTPWIVSAEDSAVTSPSLSEYCQGGNLVGSAEQGFIALMREGKLPPGRYVSAGPCFRFSDANTPGKHPYFFKVELCNVGSLAWMHMLYSAQAFMGGDITETEDGCDLYLNGIEIGSYGNRSINGMNWAYGTGLAEPRYSEALAKGIAV